MSETRGFRTAREALSSQGGFNLIEVTLAMAILSIVLLGVMAALTNASFAERETSDVLQSQLLLGQVVEETRSVAFDDLLSLNGTYVVKGSHRANITAGLVNPDLVRIQVDVNATDGGNARSRSVLFLANTGE